MTITLYGAPVNSDQDAPSVLVEGFPFAHIGRLIGSEYINGKPGRDRDVLCPPNITEDMVTGAGFTITTNQLLDEGRDYPDSDLFFTARKGDVNLIVCRDQEFYERYPAAAHTCRLFVLYTGKDMDKGLRVAIHKLIADGEPVPIALSVGQDLKWVLK